MSLKTLSAFVLITVAVVFSLSDERVIAGDCAYKYWGCGGMAQNDNTVPVADATACAAICGGRTSCSPSSPSSPYNCFYSY